LTVAHIEPFGLHPSIVDDNAAVRENTVDVEQNEFYFSRLFLDRGRDTLHGCLNDASFEKRMDVQDADRHRITGFLNNKK
jgi:hypothetical protein